MSPVYFGVGVRGGWVFEYWFSTFGKDKFWKEFMKLDKDDYSTEACHKLCTSMWATHKLRWYGWLLKGLKDITNHNTSQLFWVTLVAKAKGLSNTGQDALAKLGFCLQSKVFGRSESQQLLLQTNLVKRAFLPQSHVWWIDNYNRAYGQTFYKLSSGPMKVLNWTGWAIHRLPEHVGPLLRLTSSKPLLPKNFQNYETRIFLHQIVKDFSTSEGTLKPYFNSSFCEQHCVYNVPLKPYQTGPHISSADLATLQLHLDGLTNFVPVELLQHNVGSDVGLGKVLRQLLWQYSFEKQKSYSLCKVDVNIFWRLYLVSALGLIILEY